MDVVMATTTTHIGEFDTVIGGRLYEADHPFVKAHPDMFSADLLAHAIRTPGKRAPVVETATKAPGETRTTPPATSTTPKTPAA